MKKIIFLSMIFSLLLIAPLASSALTITQTTYTHDMTILRNQFTSVNVTIDGATPSLYGYTIYGTIGRNVSGTVPSTLLGQYFQRNVAGNGTYNFLIDEEQFPFSRMDYDINFSVSPYWKTNGTYLGTNASATIYSVSLEGADSVSRNNRIVFRHHIPSASVLDAGTLVVNDGTSVNVSCLGYGLAGCSYLDLDLYVFITDTKFPRNLLGYRVVPVSYQTFDTTGLWNSYEVNISDIAVTCGSNNFAFNHSYYIYYGVRLTGSVTALNTAVDTLDPSMSSVAFSTSSLTSAGTLMNDISLTYDFVGSSVYFECPYMGSSAFTFNWAPGTLGNDVRNYGDSIGFPFLYIIVAIILVAVCALLPLWFAMKFDLNIPNFLYIIFISIGVVIDYGINLLDLWMVVMYFILLFLSITLSYKDEINAVRTRSRETMSKLPFRKKGGDE